MKKKQKIQDGEEMQINEYYLRVSKKLRNTKYLLILLMVASLIVTLFAYRSRLTYDNLRYILRDIDEAGHTSLTSDAVYYSANETNFYANFRGDLAVASSGGIEFHRAFGSLSFEDRVNFKSPVLATSGKYMIAYDHGGNSFYVYNSISRVYSETLKHSVIDCAAADGGEFAVLTKSDVGDCVVRLYSKDFALIGEVTRAGYAYSVGFLSDGRLYICESIAKGTSLGTKISLYTVGSDDIDTYAEFDGFVFECGNSGDYIAVVMDGGVYFCDGGMSIVSEHSFGTSDLLYAHIAKTGVCVLLDKNKPGAAEEVIAYFTDGSAVSADTDYGARGVVLCKKDAVVLYDDELFVLNDTAKEVAIPDGAKEMLYINDESVLVCYNDYAKVFEVK